MIRTYARIAALVLVSLGLAGLVGLVNADGPVAFYHVAVGALFAYIGLGQRDPEAIRMMVGGMGVLLLLVKGVTMALPLLLWGEPPLHGPVEITCLVLGLSSVLAARYLRNPALPEDQEGRGRTRRSG